MIGKHGTERQRHAEQKAPESLRRFGHGTRARRGSPIDRARMPFLRIAHVRSSVTTRRVQAIMTVLSFHNRFMTVQEQRSGDRPAGPRRATFDGPPERCAYLRPPAGMLLANPQSEG